MYLKSYPFKYCTSSFPEFVNLKILLTKYKCLEVSTTYKISSFYILAYFFILFHKAKHGSLHLNSSNFTELIFEIQTTLYLSTLYSG